MCYAYAYDTLIRPHPLKEIKSFGHVIDLKRIKKAAHLLTRDFIRASLNPKEVKYLVIMCVEAGGVIRPESGTRNCMSIMWYWLERRIHELGQLREVHFNHTGGYAVEEPKPVLAPLRIRIPKNERYDKEEL
jgi:hypothetical protein